MPHARQTLGQRGEAFVASQLCNAGYTILAHNWHHGRHGELDIVARHGDEIVFVEVRTRQGPARAAVEWALASVDANKQTQLLSLAQAFLDEHDLTDREWRITIAAVGYEDEAFTLEIVKDAVEW